MNGMKYATFWNGSRRIDILLSEVEAITSDADKSDIATLHTRGGASYTISLDDSGFFDAETDDARHADLDNLAASIF